MADRVIQRNDTAARWKEVNPVLAMGEIGIETDGAKGYKIGDGVTRWNDLAYPANPTSVVQEGGTSETAVMSQKAVTEKLGDLSSKVNPLANVASVEYGHLLNIDENGGYGGYIENKDYDTAFVYVLDETTKIELYNVNALRYIYFSDSIYKNSSSFLGNNQTGEIPEGAKLCLITIKKSDNPNGYNDMIVRQDGSFVSINQFEKESERINTNIEDIKTKHQDDYDELSRQLETEGARGFTIDYNHIYSVESQTTGSYLSNNSYDSIKVSINSNFHNIILENGIATRYVYFSAPELVQDNQLGHNQTGEIPEGAKFCCINMKKSDNPDGYGNVLVRFTDKILQSSDVTKEVNIGISTFEDKVEKQYPRGYYIDYNHIFSIDGENSRYVENPSFDSVLVSVNSTYKTLFVENATPLRFCFFSSSELTYQNYLGNNTNGTVIADAKFCCITMRKSDNPNGYDNLLVRWDYNLDEYAKKSDVAAGVKSMKIVKSGSYINIRTKLSESNDIIVRMISHAIGKNMSFKDFYIGDNSLSDDEIINDVHRVGDISDMVGAIGISSFYYLYAQHGWAIPRMSVATQTLDNSDVGSKWREGDRYFYVGKVDGNYIYLIPEITYNAETGIYKASWGASNPYPTALEHVSGAVHTSSITGTSTRYDLVVQTISDRKILADELEIVDDGIYYCDNLIISEHIIGHSVGAVSQWFPTPVYDDTLIDFDRTFIWKGSSCACNTVINAINPFIIGDYRGCIPQMPMQNGDYHSYSFIPKVKKLTNGHRTDLPFNSDDGTLSPNYVSVNRSADDLYDVDNQPERCVSYLKDNNGNYLVGMAGGCSLVRGLSSPESRNKYIPQGSRTCTYGGADTKNKFYPMLLLYAGMPDGIISDSFIKELSCYYCWFDPNVNDGQVYWYKDGDAYILYCHCQNEHKKLAINLPKFMEGMVVESTIEKTEGTQLLTTQVVSGRLYVKYETTDNAANYIVVKLR